MSAMTQATLAKLLRSRDVTSLSAADLTEVLEAEVKKHGFLPDGVFRVDPRNGDRILFNSARARRPHDNRPPQATAGAEPAQADCVICEGKTSAVIDVAELSDGFTFINENQFPVLFPRSIDQPEAATGMHLLQWTSSNHDLDWHNMPLADRAVVVDRLAALERHLLTDVGCPGADNARWGDRPGHCGYVSVIKNYGRLVGGSLVHGHQQIGFGNVMPRRIADNLRFEFAHSEHFADYMLRETPDELVIRDLGPAVLLVPYFMRRPFDMFLVFSNTERRYVHDLDTDERAAMAEGWHLAIRAIRDLMPAIGRETAYNVAVHNGAGAGLYVEFLPYTQETGGFEHLGMIVCQSSPVDAAARIRDALAG